MGNSPINYTDPSGHLRIQDGDQNDRFSQSLYEEYVPNDGSDDGGGLLDKDDEEDEDDDIRFNGGDKGLPSLMTDDHNFSPCMSIFSNDTCQTISNVNSVLVFSLDLASFTLSLGGSVFALIGMAGGPIGEGGVFAGYQTLNAAEGLLGFGSMFLATTNDVFITGETYLTMDPHPEIVFGHDTSISIALALAGGADPEPFGDTIFNGFAVANDLYRLLGGDGRIEIHFAVLDLSNSYFSLP